MHTQQSIESAFEAMKERFSKKKEHNATGMQNVVQLLLDYPEKIWWWSWEIVGKNNSKGEWVSHRGPARASDLAIKCPELVEDRKIGRFAIYRLRIENIDQIQKFLSAQK